MNIETRRSLRSVTHSKVILEFSSKFLVTLDESVGDDERESGISLGKRNRSSFELRHEFTKSREYR